RSSPGIAADRQWAGGTSFSRRTPPPAKSGKRQPIDASQSAFSQFPSNRRKKREPDRHPVLSVGPAPGGLFHLVGCRLPRYLLPDDFASVNFPRIFGCNRMALAERSIASPA